MRRPKCKYRVERSSIYKFVRGKYFWTIWRSPRCDDNGDTKQTVSSGTCNLHFFDCTGLQHLGLEQGAGQGWGGLPRGSLPPHCLPPPPGHHPHTHPQPVGASAFNPFHHAIEQRSPRLPGSNAGKDTRFLYE